MTQDQEDEIIKILQQTLKEYRTLLTAGAAIVIQKKARTDQENSWLEALERYGIIKDDGIRDGSGRDSNP